MFGSAGKDPGQFAAYGLAIDNEGRFVVSDYENCRIQIFSGSGEFIKMWGSKGSGPGCLHRPTGIVVDLQGNIIICDRGMLHPSLQN